MKKVIILFTFLSSFSVLAQVDSVLFGLYSAISGPSINPVITIYLTRMNTTTGVLTNAVSSATNGGVQIGNSTIDSYNKIFYFMRSGNEIIGLNLYNGAVVSSHTVTNPNAANLHNMYFNCGDTTIYALARSAPTSTMPPMSNLYLAKVNPNTGVVTNISPNSIGNSVQLNNVTIDPYNKIYYYMTQNTMVGLSLTTGTIVSTATLSNPSSTVAYLYSGIFYNRSDSTLYGLARVAPTVSNNPASGSIYLAKFTPNGVATIISPTSVASSMQVANSSIDPYQKVYYFVNGNYQLIGISLLTGLTVTSPTITNSIWGSFIEMNYNCNFCPEPRQDLVTSISEQGAATDYLIYPNPFANEIVLDLKKSGNYYVEVRDVSSRLVLKQTIRNQNACEMDLRHFEKGLYTMRVFSADGKVSVQKIVKLE